MFNIKSAARDGGLILAVMLSTIAVVVATIGLPSAGVDTNPTREDHAVLPTTGEEGYPVLEFCKEADKVVGPNISPPDSTYAATFTLYRMKNGVQEQIDVGTYTNPEDQPNGTHYDSANNPTPAFVTKEAMACIVSKAIPPTR